MIGGQTAFLLLTTVALIQSAEVVRQISLIEVEGGGNVTLHCPVSRKEGKFVHWYKQSPGYVVQTVATGSFTKQILVEQFNSARFKVTEDESQYSLIIRNVRKEDEATYFCQYGTAYSQSINTSIYLTVNDHSEQKSVYVKQTPETASVQLGSSVTLQCSLFSTGKENTDWCPEHDVYWLRAASGRSHPTIIYTHRNGSGKLEGKKCVHSLSKTILNSSDTGTYYCAMVTCGEILFGEGTHVETKAKLDLVVLVLSVLLACSVTVNGAFLLWKNQRVFKHGQGTKNASSVSENDMLTVGHSTDMDGGSETVNYVALNFSSRKVKGMKKKKESPQECVYSAVRTNNHTLHQSSL